MQAQPGADYMKMTPGEQDAAGVHGEGEGHQKKSVVGKVKNKAKKLTSKIKGVGKKKKNAQGTEMEGQVHGNEEAEDTSSSSSEGEQEEETSSPQIAHTGPLKTSPEMREDHPVHGGERYDKDKSGVDQASRGLAGLNLGGIEAKQDPNVPSYDDETTKRQTVPSAIGQDTAQVSPGLMSGLGGVAYGQGHEKSGSEGLGSGHDSSYGSGFGKDSTHEKSGYDRGLGSGHDSGYGSGFGKDSTHERDSSVEAGVPVGEHSDVKIPEGIMKPRKEESKPVVDGVDKSGRDFVSSEVLGSGQPEGMSRPSETYGENDQDKPLSEKAKGAVAGGLGLGGLAAGTAAGEHATHDDEQHSTDPQQQKGWMQRASESVASVKNVITSKLASPRASDSAPTFGKAPEDKTYTESARDTAIGAKDATRDAAIGAKDYTRDSAVGAKDYTRDSAIGAKDYTRDTAIGAKDATGEKMNAAAETGKSWTEQAKQAMISAKDTVASKLPSSTGTRDSATGAKDYTRDTALGAKDATRDTAIGAKDATGQKMGAAADTGKSWTEQAKEAVLSAKDTVASKLPSSTAPKDISTETNSAKPLTTRAGETATGMKDALASTVGYGSTPASEKTATNQPATAGGPTVTEKVMGTVTGVKDTVASKLGYGGTTGTTGAGTGTGYGGTTTGTTTGAEAAKRFHPDEHDTALSQKITDMLSLGGGSKASPTTPSTTTTTITTEHTPRTTDEVSAGSPTAQGKGYVDRVTDVVGSLLGKKPADAATGTDATVTHQ